MKALSTQARRKRTVAILGQRLPRHGNRPSRRLKWPARATGTEEVRPLSAQFEIGGWSFRLMARCGNACLYVKTKPGASGQPMQSWEVVIPVVRKAGRFPSGQWQPTREVYPADEQWGNRGWTFLTEREARQALTTKAASTEDQS